MRDSWLVVGHKAPLYLLYCTHRFEAWRGDWLQERAPDESARMSGPERGNHSQLSFAGSPPIALYLFAERRAAGVLPAAGGDLPGACRAAGGLASGPRLSGNQLAGRARLSGGGSARLSGAVVGC